MTCFRRRPALPVVALLACIASGPLTFADEFRSDWPDVERIWIGPEYWGNRIHDWRIANQRLECVTAGADRNVHLLTYQLGPQPGAFEIRVRLGALNDRTASGKGWAGFRFAARGRFDDYRESAIYGKGIDAGLNMDGRLFIADQRAAGDAAKHRRAESQPIEGFEQHLRRGTDGQEGRISADTAGLELRLEAKPENDGFELQLSARAAGGSPLGRLDWRISANDLHGNVALVCHSDQPAQAPVRVWFSDWQVSGEKVEAHPDQTFGPILFAQHTLSRNVLNMTAQLPPLGEQDSSTVRLELDYTGKGAWTPAGTARIDPFARTATWRVEMSEGHADTPYRIIYPLTTAGGARDCVFEGTVRRDPADKPQIVVAAFTGNNDAGFPNTEVVHHVAAHEPDLLVFTGDQIYERVGGYGVQRSPLEAACLDYLRKWYIFGWSYRDLMASIPSVCLPDDHDVFHGNLWGCGGKAARGTGKPGQDSGGYTMPAEFVKMVERTQTSHLPEPYDPTPVKQGIGVYYCSLNVGGVSFAVIEDRKFKSAPKELLPVAQVDNGWFQNPDFDPTIHADVPGAQLLGERQERFLADWAVDWSGGAWMKVVLSQTIFANVATLPPPANTDAVTRSLPILQPGEYPEGEVPVADADSNGWPPSPRNTALREMRRCFAFHIAGDQHLGSTIQYGIDDWNDAGFALCVPSVANVWPRRWFPPEPGANHKPGAPRYTGDYRDGFGNRMTVHAVCNPAVTGRQPADLYDRATGYGIVRFSRKDRSITIENWPRYVDPKDPTAGGPYFGWPITIHQLDNYSRRPAGFLPPLEVKAAIDPVVQIVDEADSEVVYTLRIQGKSFRPMVFEDGTYTVRIIDPDRGRKQVRKSLTPIPPNHPAQKTIVVDLR